MSGSAQGVMRRVPLAVETYEHSSLALSAKRLVNVYAEKQPADARSEMALVSTPGLEPSLYFGPGPILAINQDSPGLMYVVSGSGFWRKRSGIDPEYLGEIGIPSFAGGVTHIVTIAQGPTSCVVCCPPNAYTCTHGGTLNQIAGDYPGAQAVAYLDGYYVFAAMDNSSQFFVSKLLDPTAYDALDFAYSDAIPNVIRNVKTLHGQVWMLGEAGIEIWYDAGAADFPLRRADGGVIPFGVAHASTAAVGDGSMFWVGIDGIVYRSVGYQAKRISTHAIEQFIRDSGPTSGTDGMFFSFNGHSIYCVSYGERTFCYDCATSLWHERSSSVDGSARWRASCSCFFGAALLLGDRLSGLVFAAAARSPYEMDMSVVRLVTSPPIWANTNRAMMYRLEVEMDVGSTPVSNINIAWSDDGGHTWSGSRDLAPAAPGQFRARIVTTRLGSFRQRVLRLTARGQVTFYGLDALMVEGNGG